jgi:hypothetical protein
MKTLDLFAVTVTEDNIDDMNLLLSTIAESYTFFPQFSSLSLGNINLLLELIVPNIPQLASLSIDALVPLSLPILGVDPVFIERSEPKVEYIITTNGDNSITIERRFKLSKLPKLTMLRESSLKFDFQ